MTVNHAYTAHYNDESFLKKMRRFAGKIPLSKDVMAMYYCMCDSHTPLRVKLTIMGCLAYVVCPLDVVPDAVPVAGFFDDGSAIISALATVEHFITDVHRECADAFFES